MHQTERSLNLWKLFNPDSELHVKRLDCMALLGETCEMLIAHLMTVLMEINLVKKVDCFCRENCQKNDVVKKIKRQYFQTIRE